MHRRAVFLAFLAHFAANAQLRAVTVPYKGCKSDTFVEGPLEAPSGHEAAVAPGVLGPRGWYCFRRTTRGRDTRATLSCD
jgi:hypothetical protein